MKRSISHCWCRRLWVGWNGYVQELFRLCRCEVNVNLCLPTTGTPFPQSLSLSCGLSLLLQLLLLATYDFPEFGTPSKNSRFCLGRVLLRISQMSLTNVVIVMSCNWHQMLKCLEWLVDRQISWIFYVFLASSSLTFCAWMSVEFRVFCPWRTLFAV